MAEITALSLHAALTRRSAAVRPVPVLLEGLGTGWVLLSEVLIGGPEEAPARIDLVLLHAGLGIALLERAPRWTADAPARLRQRLVQARFPAIFPGELPVVHCQLHRASLDMLPRLLTESFGAQPPLSLPGGTAWVGTVRRALTQPSPLAEAPPPPPEPAPPRWGQHVHHTVAGMAAVVGLGGLALLLLLLLRSVPPASSTMERSRAAAAPSGRQAAAVQPGVAPVARVTEPGPVTEPVARPLLPDSAVAPDLAQELAGGEDSMAGAWTPAIASASPDGLGPAETMAAAPLPGGGAALASLALDTATAALPTPETVATVPGLPGGMTDALTEAPEMEAAIPALLADAKDAGPALMPPAAAATPPTDAAAGTIPPDGTSGTMIAAEPAGAPPRIPGAEPMAAPATAEPAMPTPETTAATGAEPIAPAPVTEAMGTAFGSDPALQPSSESAGPRTTAATLEQPAASSDTTAEASPAAAPQGEAMATMAAPDLAVASPSPAATTTDASPAPPEAEAAAIVPDRPSVTGKASPLPVPRHDAAAPAPLEPAEAIAAPATAPRPSAEAIPAQPVEAEPAASPPSEPPATAVAILPPPAAPVEPPPPLAAAPAVPPPATVPRPTTGHRADPAQLAALMRRGDALLATGDVSGARRFYERAAEAGSAEAARAAGRTHDPAALIALGARGIRPDPQAAAAWYRRADALAASEHAE